LWLHIKINVDYNNIGEQAKLTNEILLYTPGTHLKIFIVVSPIATHFFSLQIYHIT